MKVNKGSYQMVTYLVVVLVMLGSCKPSAKDGKGCTDPQANNTNPEATENDGNCTYDPVWIVPVKTMDLSEVLRGTSGLISWRGRVLTHNDHADTKLYEIDTATAQITKEYHLPGVTNTDWEDIAEDGEYIYVGDFGNNASGNRTDLHILRIEMASLLSEHPSIDTIWFSYSDQDDLSPTNPNQTDFDCEAMIVSSDNIYLFTKQWLTGHTTFYSLSKEPGKHVAQREANYDIRGMVTGAVHIESEHLLALCGYTSILQPFIFLFYDYTGDNFFSGNKRRVNISIPFLQVEGITTANGIVYYLSNESFVLEPATNNPQKLHLFDLSELLEDYLPGTSI